MPWPEQNEVRSDGWPVFFLVGGEQGYPLPSALAPRDADAIHLKHETGSLHCVSYLGNTINTTPLVPRLFIPSSI